MTRREGFVALTGVLLSPLFKIFESVAVPAGFRPDFLLLLAVSCGWSCDVWAAAPAGFAVGLVEDLIVGRALGMRSASLAAAAVTASLLRRVINPDSAVSKILAALASAVVADAASLVILRSAGVELGYQYLARKILPVTVAWAGVLALPMDFIVTRISRALSGLWPARRGRDREAAA